MAMFRLKIRLPIIFFLFVIISLCSANKEAISSDGFVQMECLSVPPLEFAGAAKTAVEAIEKAVAIVSKFEKKLGKSRVGNAILDCVDLLDSASEALSWIISASKNPNEVYGLISGLILSSKEADKLPKYEESMGSYISACQEDPELQSFGSLLHQRIIKLASSLASRVGQGEILSLDSLIEVCGFLVELSQDVAKIITDCKENVSKNKELKSLVDLNYESTNKTLNLFNTVEKCVEKANIIQLLIRVAIKQFDTESLDTDFVGGNKKKEKYAKTLETLNEVKAMGDPFGEEFETQYKSIFDEQVKILDKIHEAQVMFEKKHKNAKILRTMGKIVFVSAFVSVIALGIYCIKVASFPMVDTIVTGMTAVTTIAAAGVWLEHMFNDYEKALEIRKDLCLLTEDNTKVNIEAMKTIKNLVETLITRISSVLKSVEVAVEHREEETVKLVMQEISRKVEAFAEKIEEVGTNVARCSKVVASGRVLVLEHIANSASLEGKEIRK